jgi:hypothetical protein
MEVGSRRVWRFWWLLVVEVALLLVLLVDVLLLAELFLSFRFLGTRPGITGRGVTVRTSSGVSGSIHPAPVGCASSGSTNKDASCFIIEL